MRNWLRSNWILSCFIAGLVIAVGAGLWRVHERHHARQVVCFDTGFETGVLQRTYICTFTDGAERPAAAARYDLVARGWDIDTTDHLDPLLSCSDGIVADQIARLSLCGLVAFDRIDPSTVEVARRARSSYFLIYDEEVHSARFEGCYGYLVRERRGPI